ncbi:MAG: hypothetical protein K2W96_07915, partial [Gemmataceae bacterium]|nr:hypothetical protein [Gemmataceae bacterium]
QLWQAASAHPGYRLLVAADDAERALQLLAEEDEAEPASPPSEEFTADPPEPEERPANKREDAASRGFLCSVLGVLVVPLQLYTAYLVMDAWSSEEPLRPMYRRALRWATGIVLLYATLVLGFVAMILAARAEGRL